ncbi:hypothetical protein [Scytonema sp. PRP1]|uniref:hypothetical protein n=1 Tax=Scytonema sp. PRP1 TaxID=3120513 RepID=UPI002FD7559D
MEPGNTVEAILPLLRQAERAASRHSQPEAGNKAISKSLFYAGFHLKLTGMGVGVRSHSKIYGGR